MVTSSTQRQPTPSADRGTYTYVSVFSAVLYTVLLIAPVIGVKLATQFGFSASQIGLLFSLELGGFSLATLPAYVWLHRFNLRTVTYLCMTVVIAGNIASGLVSSYGGLLTVRFITTLAAGSITVILLSLSGRTSNPSRAFGLFVVCQLAMGALILAVFPLIFADSGVAAIYWTLAALGVLTLPFVRLIDGDALHQPLPAAHAAHAAAGKSSTLRFALGLAAVLLFYVALSSVWTFIGQISADAGNSPNSTSITLSIATVAGIASALLATVLGDSPHRRLFLLIGYLAMALSVALLFGAPALIRFAIAAVIFKFAWTFILPYLLSALADLHSGPHIMNTTNLMIGGGFAIGPLLGGLLIDSTGSFTGMLIVSFVGVLASGLCIQLGYVERATHDPLLVEAFEETAEP